MNNRKTRSSLIGVAGAYLLYMAYQLFRDRNEPGTTMPQGLAILFAALFLIAAVALLVYAYRSWKQADREEKEESPPDDPDSLK